MARNVIGLAGAVAAAAALLLAGCAQKEIRADTLDIHRDHHSYANTEDFQTRHLVLDLGVNFDKRVLTGTVELQLRRLQPEAEEVVLDTRDIDIAKVETGDARGSWRPATFKLDERDAILGSALRIPMPGNADRVRVHYTTRPDASGLQWVTPAQTAGKKQPFLYTQSQAIHARSWIPLQDTPQVRSTYDATLRVPPALMAVMSASNRTDLAKDGVYTFTMQQPVPSYLIALGVGDLRFKPIGKRSGIYAEPSVVEAAAREFADVEKMMAACEKLYGPYRWDRYDMLVLPPSFPYGGMENPRLTFLTPTAIVGDKSGVSLIAHELAHSWSGNLVTNATWRDFWLNEGTTTYLTYRIMDVVFDQRRGDMERVLGQQDLVTAFAQAAKPGDRALAFDQRGRDPDEVGSQIPYERGQLFFYYLEQKFGRATFDAFLRAWFDDNAFASRTTEDFIAYAEKNLLAKQPKAVTRAKLDEWIYQPELPADAVYAKSDAFAKVEAQRVEWLAGKLPTAKLRTEKWTSHEWQHFFDTMPDTVKTAQLAELDKRFKLTGARDTYLAVAWYRVAIRHNYEPALPAVERLLLSVGRMLFLKPLYRELVKSEPGRAFARRVYAQAKPTYHPIAAASVERLLAEGSQPGTKKQE